MLVAERVVERGSVSWRKCELSIHRLPEKITHQGTVVVSGLSEDTDEEFITLYFKNEKRSGGGAIKQVQFDPDKNMAFVSFEDPQGTCRPFASSTCRLG